MKIDRTEKFRKDYEKLEAKVRKAAAKQITQLLLDHSHPSLRVEGIQGRKGIFSARVDQRWRMSFQFRDDGSILLRRVLDHDELYRSP